MTPTDTTFPGVRTPRTGRRGSSTVPMLLPAHAVRTMPWAPLLTGCVAGTLMLWLLRFAAQQSHWSVNADTMRFTLLPVVAGLAFVPRTAFRPVIDAVPAPAWLMAVGQVVLALPVLALTCWMQVLLIQPAGAFTRPPAVAALLAQFTGWCAVTVAAATCTDRSRYADLGGAVAAPASLALIGLALFGPKISHVLATPPASRHTAIVAWYAIAAVAVVVAGAAIRDRWHRYGRILPMLPRRKSANLTRNRYVVPQWHHEADEPSRRPG